MPAPIKNQNAKKYKTAQGLQKAINGYFDTCDRDGRPYTFLGIAVHLGISKDTASAYLNDVILGSTMQAAKHKCELYAAERLYSGGNTRGIEFALKYCYGYEDKTKIEISGPGGGPLAVNIYIPDNGRDEND